MLYKDHILLTAWCYIVNITTSMLSSFSACPSDHLKKLLPTLFINQVDQDMILEKQKTRTMIMWPLRGVMSVMGLENKFQTESEGTHDYLPIVHVSYSMLSQAGIENSGDMMLWEDTSRWYKWLGILKGTANNNTINK